MTTHKREAKQNKKKPLKIEMCRRMARSKKTVVQRVPSDPIEHKTLSQQQRRIYSADEKTTAHALLNLSVPVIFANYYTAMELMAAQSLFHFFKLLLERSIE